MLLVITWACVPGGRRNLLTFVKFSDAASVTKALVLDRATINGSVVSVRASK